MNVAITITSTILSSLGIGSILSFFITRKIAKIDRKNEERENQRNQTDVLVLQSIYTIGSLSKATVIALKNGKCNGESEAALNEYEKCKRNLDNHLIKISTENRSWYYE